MVILNSVVAHMRGLPDRSREAAGCLAISIALAAISPALAQTDQGDATPREGNIYDHKAHQPTAADVCTGGTQPDKNCPSEVTRQVEDEVQKLLRETDRDLQTGRQQLDLPGGSSTLPAGIR